MTYGVTVSCEKVNVTSVNSSTIHSHSFEVLKLGDSAAVQMEVLHVFICYITSKALLSSYCSD